MELGHCLNLYHTFYGTNSIERLSGSCAEAIDGSNCRTCGDYVCDTPADDGHADNNGFTPDLTNIMSYYRSIDHFTNGQGARMRTALSVESVLDDITGNSCLRISKVDNVCFPQSTTITLSNLGNATTTWTSSANVQILSSNNTSATLIGRNNNSSDRGWIRATLDNGIEYTEDFEVGVPDISFFIIGNNSYGGGSNIHIGVWNIMQIQGYDNVNNRRPNYYDGRQIRASNSLDESR